MKAKFFLFAFLSLLFTQCRKPSLPKPGEPVIDVRASDKPAIPLPWKAIKGARLASIANLERTPRIFL